MQYNINLKNIKQSATNLGKFLKDYNIPRNIILEATAKIFFFKNWNTLEGISTKPNIIEHLNIQKRYLFEIEAQIDEKIFMEFFKECFTEGKANLNIINFLNEKKNDNFNYFHIEIDLMKSDQNILTAMFLLCDKFKKKNISVTKFDYCRLVCEKESFMEFFKEKSNQHYYSGFRKAPKLYFDTEKYESELMIQTLKSEPSKEALEFYESLDTQRDIKNKK